MLSISPLDTPQPLFHQYMLGAIAPRPIAFASTIDKNGNPNLSPFSFFNAFGSAPPIVVFSPALSGKTARVKDTVINVREIPEVVINVVTYSMYQQASLASAEFPKEVNEFVKSGFTPIPSKIVKPFRVKESPAQMECKVLEIKETGTKGGAGNLIICEILLIHINEDILDAENRIDPNKIDLIGRMGRHYYCRASGSALFELPQPVRNLGIGIDALPESIRKSKIFTGNNLGQLGNVTKLPTEQEIKDFADTIYFSEFKNAARENIEIEAKSLLEQNRVEEAWKLLLAYSF